MNMPLPRMQPLLRAGLEPPKLDGVLAPLTLLHADAGMGKTLLAAQWSRNRSFGIEDVRWVRAPRSGIENDLWAAICDRVSDGTGMPPSPEWGTHADHAFALMTRLTAPQVLIIDDYQLVSSVQLDPAIAQLLELTPLLHLVILSRHFSTLDGPLVTTRMPVVELRSEDLAFTLAESRQLATQRGISSVERVDRLHHDTQGWPVAVNMVLLESVQDGGAQALSTQFSRFAIQQFHGVPNEKAKLALLYTALCERISIDLLAEFLELRYAEAEALMSDLCERGLVKRHWYPYTVRFACHPGLIRSLQIRAEHEFGHDVAHEFARRHAVELGRDEPYPAVVRLLELEEFEDASRLIARNLFDLFTSARELASALSQVPDTVLGEHAMLVGARLLLELDGPHSDVETIDALHRTLRQASLTAMQRDDAEIRIVSQSLLVAAERMRGNLVEALRQARDLEQRMRRAEHDIGALLNRSMPLIHAVIALTGLLAGDASLAERNFAHTVDYGVRLDRADEQIRGHNGLALTFALDGDLRRALVHLNHAERIAQLHRAESPQLSWINAVIARLIIDLEHGRGDALTDALAQLRPVSDYAEQWPLIVAAEVAGQRIAAGPLSALQLITVRAVEAENRPASLPLFTDTLAAQEANCLALLGDYTGARARLDAIVGTPANVQVVRARLEFLKGNHDTAIDLAGASLRLSSIDRALAHAEEVWSSVTDARQHPALSPRLSCEAWLVLAVAHWRHPEAGEEHHDAATSAFEMAASIAELNGLRLPFTLVPFDALSELAEESDGRSCTRVSAILASLPPTMKCEQFEALSPAELRTMRALAQTGLTLSEVAETLFITKNTLKFHLKSIYRKLRAGTREEAILRAQQRGLLELDRTPQRAGKLR